MLRMKRDQRQKLDQSDIYLDVRFGFNRALRWIISEGATSRPA